MANGLLPGEREVYRTGLHAVLPVGSALIAAALIIGRSLCRFAFLAYRASECVVTNRRVLLKAGVLIRKTTEILLTKVEIIDVERDPLGRILGFGTVVVGGTGSTRQRFPFVRDPDRFGEKVRQAVEAAQRPEPARA